MKALVTCHSPFSFIDFSIQYLHMIIEHIVSKLLLYVNNVDFQPYGFYMNSIVLWYLKILGISFHSMLTSFLSMFSCLHNDVLKDGVQGFLALLIPDVP